MSIDTTADSQFDRDNSPRVPGALSNKKLRTFCTLMTDAELAERRILVVPTDKQEQVVKWFVSDDDFEKRNAPILHAVNLQDFGGLSWPEQRDVVGLRVRSDDKRQKLIGQIETRISQLEEIACEEDVPFSKHSASNALQFLQGLRFGAKPSVFLVGNGNVRIVWRNEAGEQAAFQVKSEKQEVQYVIFCLNEDKGLDQILGSMSFKSVYPFLRGLDLVPRLLWGRKKRVEITWSR